MFDPQPWEVGDKTAPTTGAGARDLYEIVRPNYFGPLPLAVIGEGHPNAGVNVILHRPWKDA